MTTEISVMYGSEKVNTWCDSDEIRQARGTFCSFLYKHIFHLYWQPLADLYHEVKVYKPSMCGYMRAS